MNYTKKLEKWKRCILSLLRNGCSNYSKIMSILKKIKKITNYTPIWSNRDHIGVFIDNDFIFDLKISILF